tara:strand:+ start:573 stop:1016 length:444 start_codon:yes stop_codon:yes gene_type:complete
MDYNLIFGEKQAVTTTAKSTNVINLNVARNIAVGEKYFVQITLVESMADSGSDATVVPTLIQGSSLDGSNDISSPTVIHTGKTFAATSSAGTRTHIPLPVDDVYGTLGQDSYLQINYTVANGPLTAGKFTALLVREVENSTKYPDGI